jgi:phosphatidylserine decarboxylase precursor-related protein
MPQIEIQHIPYKRTAPELLVTVLPRPRIIKEGWPRVAGFLAAAGLFGWLSTLPALAKLARLADGLAKVCLGGSLFTAYVYRDPRREPLGNAPDYIYAPVDGTILKIEPVEDEPLFIKGPAYRLLITSQPLDVAVLRMPLPGQIAYIHQQPGEATKVGIKNKDQGRLLLTFRSNPYKRVSLPRPLAAKKAVNLFTEAGQSLWVTRKLGMRGFGAALLTTLYIPQERELLCRTGQHTQAGMTVLGRIKPARASLL